jgi:Na+-driven multidrug efflux pump
LTPTVINLGCYWIVQLPLAALLAFYYRLESEGVFIAMFVAESLLALVGFLVFRTGRWQLAKA